MPLTDAERQERRARGRERARRRRRVVLVLAAAVGALAAAAVALSLGTDDTKSTLATPPPARKAERLEPPVEEPRPAVPTIATKPSPAPPPTPKSVPKPAIVWNPIPFSDTRRAEMAEYSSSHYGEGGWQLTNPRVIVQHYTVSDTWQSAYSTFAADVPDSELNELPGTCAHFVIDGDGTIFQLVRLDTRCRHTVGLNWTAIGIEHVGRSAQDVFSRPAQLRASLALSLWLMKRYGIELRNVIGHNESLTSPYRKELHPAWRCQTHGDFTTSEMAVYRADLKQMAKSYGIGPGSPATSVDSGC